MSAWSRFAMFLLVVVFAVLFAPVFFAWFMLVLLGWLVLGLPFALWFGRVVRWSDGAMPGRHDDGARRGLPRGIGKERRNK